MSAHAWSFPNDEPYNRDLSDQELWERSLRRSQHRREITELARKHAARRKGAAVAVSASMAVGPAAAPFAALASAGGGKSVAAAPPGSSAPSAISMPSSSLVAFGDTGAAVAAVQRQVGVDDDGIFGPITQSAVSSFQKRYGLPVTGRVDAKTWQALFRSNVTYVGGGGKTVMTVYSGGGGGAAAPAVDGSAPSSSAPGGSGKTSAPTSKQVAATAPKKVTSAAPKSSSPATSTDPATNRAATTTPKSVPTTPASAPAASAGGCGSGPIATPVSGTVTGTFGESRPGHLHAGQDIATAAGTPVRAAQCGTVTQAGFDGSGYGNLICIQHEGGVSTCYAHLSEIDTTKGAYVHVGDVIGKVGCTGNCTGPHLHFEVRENGKATNPAPYLAGSKTIQGKT
ncbi:MAG TPA: peptidoglycan DD-metalloendopeptidase family protein, partial [Solirubrobacter sp.]